MKNWCSAVLDWHSGALAAGLDCYRRQQFFEAHEHWELEWLRLLEPERSFLQAIIQITAALHHWQRSEIAGARSLLRRAQQRLAACPPAFGGIAVAPLRAEIAEWLASLDAGHPGGAFPAIVPLPPSS